MLIVKVKQVFPLREFTYTLQGEQKTGRAVALVLATKYGNVYAEAYDSLAEDIDRNPCDMAALYICELSFSVSEYKTDNNVVIRRTAARIYSLKKF